MFGNDLFMSSFEMMDDANILMDAELTDGDASESCSQSCKKACVVQCKHGCATSSKTSIGGTIEL